MSAVRDDLKELAKIYDTIKKLSNEIKELRDRKKDLETNLLTYLQERKKSFLLSR